MIRRIAFLFIALLAFMPALASASDWQPMLVYMSRSAVFAPRDQQKRVDCKIFPDKIEKSWSTPGQRTRIERRPVLWTSQIPNADAVQALLQKLHRNSQYVEVARKDDGVLHRYDGRLYIPPAETDLFILRSEGRLTAHRTGVEARMLVNFIHFNCVQQ
jgi:hypothetical protein